MTKPEYRNLEEVRALLDTRSYPQNFWARCLELKQRPSEYVSYLFNGESHRQRKAPKPVVLKDLTPYATGIIRALRQCYMNLRTEYGWPWQGDWADPNEDISAELLFYIQVFKKLMQGWRHREITTDEVWDVLHELLGIE